MPRPKTCFNFVTAVAYDDRHVPAIWEVASSIQVRRCRKSESARSSNLIPRSKRKDSRQEENQRRSRHGDQETRGRDHHHAFCAGESRSRAGHAASAARRWPISPAGGSANERLLRDIRGG